MRNKMNMISKHLRLVVDKSDVPKMNKDIINGRSFKAPTIDFKDFKSGEYYLVPYSIRGHDLVGTVYYVYYISFDEKTGVIYYLTPTEAVFEVEKNSHNDALSTLESTNGSMIFFGSCWSSTRILKVYKEQDKESAIEDFNKDIEMVTSARDAYLTNIKNKEIKKLLKLKV